MHMLAYNFAVGFARTVRAGVAYQAALSMHLHVTSLTYAFCAAMITKNQ